MDTYLKVMAAYNAALMVPDPRQTDLTVLDKYTDGQAHKVLLGSLTANPGVAWRGTPWTSRVEVQTRADGAAAVILTDCPVPTASWVQYDVATGQTIPQQVRTPPPPYLITVVVGKSLGTWTMSDYHLDGSKTCTR